MFRIVRMPAPLDQFFRTLCPRFHWNHYEYFRLLVLVMAFAWGRRNVATLYRYLDAQHHRTRFNTVFLVPRWDPAAALRQKAQERLRALHPTPGETLSLVIDDAKQATRGTAMDAVAKMKDPTIDAYIRGHQDVGGILVFRQPVLPDGVRLYVKKAHGPALGVSCRKTTEVAAPGIRECTPPTGVKVMVLCDAYYLCHTVVQACRDKSGHVASTLQSNRSRCQSGWRLKAGRYGRTLFRRRRTEPLVLTKPQGQTCYRCIDAGWLSVRPLGPLHVVCSRKGTARQILGLVSDAPALSATGLMRTYEKRWAVEQFFKDSQQLLGLGPYQNRSYGAAVTHLHLVCFAYALLTHRRIERSGAQDQRTRQKAADLSTAAAQDQLRGLLWDDLITYLREKRHGQPVIEALERLRIA